MPPTHLQRRPLTASLAPAPFNDRFARVLGSALTPQQVTSILANAEIGWMWAQADLLDECRERDGHLHAELQKRELRVAGAPWELTPAAGRGRRAKEIADWCTARLREIEAADALDRSFTDAIADLMGAVYQGRAGHEATWRREGRWLIPERLAWVHPRRFAYATDWRLHLWDASGTATTSDAPEDANGPFGRYPGLPLDRFPAGKFIIHSPRVRGVYPTREGLGRLLVWWSCFKRFDVRDLLAYAEWAGRGLRLGKFASGKGKMGETPATDEDVEVLRQVLAAMSSTTAAVVPDDTEAEVLGAPTNNDVHDRLAALCNAEMSKAIIGGTLGSEVTRGGGNRALGEVHERNELMIARADAAALASTLHRALLAPMVRMNFGEGAPVPSITFAVDPAQDLDALAKRMQVWVAMGGRIGAVSGANALQLPEIESDEETLGGKPETPAAGAVSPGTPVAPSEDASVETEKT